MRPSNTIFYISSSISHTTHSHLQSKKFRSPTEILSPKTVKMLELSRSNSKYSDNLVGTIHDDWLASGKGGANINNLDDNNLLPREATPVRQPPSSSSSSASKSIASSSTIITLTQSALSVLQSSKYSLKLSFCSKYYYSFNTFINSDCNSYNNNNNNYTNYNNISFSTLASLLLLTLTILITFCYR